MSQPTSKDSSLVRFNNEEDLEGKRPPLKANQYQIAGDHYNTGYQHWDFVADTGLSYFAGQATKYISRWRKKAGLSDLRKALHFAVKLNELTREGRVLVWSKAVVNSPQYFSGAHCRTRPGGEVDNMIALFFLHNEHLSEDDRYIIQLIVEAELNQTPGKLQTAIGVLGVLVSEEAQKQFMDQPKQA